MEYTNQEKYLPKRKKKNKGSGTTEKKPTIEEYKEFGIECRELHNRLTELYVNVAGKTGKTKKPAIELKESLKILDKSISDLEELMFSHYPNLGDDGLKIFYGKAEQ